MFVYLKYCRLSPVVTFDFLNRKETSKQPSTDIYVRLEQIKTGQLMIYLADSK